MRFVDANVFLRFLTRDDPAKAAACRALFRRAEHGEERIVTSDVVIAEVIYVLTSPRVYGLSPVDAEARVRPLVGLQGLVLPRKRRVLRALTLYAAWQWADFEDALTVATMEEQDLTEIYTYDRGFDAGRVVRVEPPPAS